MRLRLFEIIPIKSAKSARVGDSADGASAAKLARSLDVNWGADIVGDATGKGEALG